MWTFCGLKGSKLITTWTLSRVRIRMLMFQLSRIIKSFLIASTISFQSLNLSNFLKLWLILSPLKIEFLSEVAILQSVHHHFSYKNNFLQSRCFFLKMASKLVKYHGHEFSLLKNNSIASCFRLSILVFVKVCFSIIFL